MICDKCGGGKHNIFGGDSTSLMSEGLPRGPEKYTL
jgi:hypothetical protein